MKKDLIFAPIMLIVAASLFFLRFTQLPAHIIISIVGAIVLIAYTVLTKKEWKIPALEIVTRLFYGVALITGAILMKVPALAIPHKISAVVFIAGMIVVLASKLAAKKKS